jgi:DNA-binding MarR family transcriptional regulator
LEQTDFDREGLHELVQLLALLARRLRGGTGVPKPLRDAFRDGSLSPRHMPVLFSLTRSGPSSVGELAAQLGLAPATVSLLVNDLNRARLLDRREDEHDRRRTIVSVPSEHRRLLTRLADERIALVRRTFARLDPDARSHFVEGLRILVEESAALGAGAGDEAEVSPGGTRR